jgi:hypothetical protein
MIRLSVTDLESYRYWKADEDSTLDQLLVRLRHEEPPTPAMKAGRAFAKLFENIDDGLLGVADVDGWRFDFTRLEAEIALPPVRELKAEVRFETPSGPVVLVGKTDGLHGTVVHDQKLTEKWDAEKYVDSLQWRAYLAMFSATSFTYDVFIARYQERHVTVTDYHPMTFYAYPGLRQDVERAVAELAAVVREHLAAPGLQVAP